MVQPSGAFFFTHPVYVTSTYLTNQLLLSCFSVFGRSLLCNGWHYGNQCLVDVCRESVCKGESEENR